MSEYFSKKLDVTDEEGDTVRQTVFAGALTETDKTIFGFAVPLGQAPGL